MENLQPNHDPQLDAPREAAAKPAGVDLTDVIMTIAQVVGIAALFVCLHAAFHLPTRWAIAASVCLGPFLGFGLFIAIVSLGRLLSPRRR